MVTKKTFITSKQFKSKEVRVLLSVSTIQIYLHENTEGSQKGENF